jgi:hypothetical protein
MLEETNRDDQNTTSERIKKLRADLDMIVKMDRIAGEQPPDAVDAPRRPILLDPTRRPEDES